MPAADIEHRRVLLIEDDHLVRTALRLLLETAYGLEVAEAASAQEAREVAASSMFDLALIDVVLPGEDGLSVLRWLRSMMPDIAALMLSGHELPDSVREAFALGARGYIVKGATSDQLREAIETALDGSGIYVHPRVAGYLFPPPAEAPSPLTPRERLVLARLADGISNDEIAKALFISPKTVKGHLSEIYRKLGVANRTQAVTWAMGEAGSGRGEASPATPKRRG